MAAAFHPAPALPACATLVVLALGLTACGKKETPVAKSEPKPAPAKTAVDTDKTMLTALVPDDKKPEADERDEKLEQAIADYKREHPFNNAEELLKQEAFLKALAPVLQAAAKNHQFGERVQKAVDFAAALRDGTAKPGSFRLDLKVQDYTPERTDRLLGTVLSGDPERLVKFVTSEVSEAAVEFSYAGQQQRASNGVALEPNNPPQPPSPAK